MVFKAELDFHVVWVNPLYLIRSNFYSDSDSKQYYKFVWIYDIECIRLFNNFKLRNQCLYLIKIICSQRACVYSNGSRSQTKNRSDLYYGSSTFYYKDDSNWTGKWTNYQCLSNQLVYKTILICHISNSNNKSNMF